MLTSAIRKQIDAIWNAFCMGVFSNPFEAIEQITYVHDEVVHRPPGEILKNLARLEKEITAGMKDLENMLK